MNLLGHVDQFGMEGYLSLLVGQQVPCKRPYVPSPEEQNAWQQIRQGVYHRVSRAFSAREAYELVRSPGWVWPDWLFNKVPQRRNWNPSVVR